MRYLLILLILFSLNLYSQKNIFCSIEKGKYLLSFKKVVDFEYQLNESEKKIIPIEMTIDYGVFVENDSIKFNYILFDMNTIGVNPLSKKWDSEYTYQLIFTFNDNSKLKLKNITPSCIYEMTPLNKTLTKILSMHLINENDISKLTSHRITNIGIERQKEKILEIDIPKKEAMEFKKSMTFLLEKIKNQKITFANIGYR